MLPLFAAQSTFSLLQIPTGRIWLDGNDTNGTNGATPVATGTAIGTWVNKFGQANFVQGSGTAQPVFTTNVKNGLGGVVFDGVNDTFSYPASLLDIANGDNIGFLVLKKNVDDATADRAIIMLNSGIAKYVMNYGAATNTIPFHNFSSDANYISVSANILNYNIIRMRLNSTTQGIRVNNATEVTGTGAATGAITSGNIFSQGGALALPGTLLEYIHYASFLSAAQRLQIIQYLAQKWAITITP